MKSIYIIINVRITVIPILVSDAFLLIEKISIIRGLQITQSAPAKNKNGQINIIGEYCGNKLANTGADKWVLRISIHRTMVSITE